MSRSAGSPDLVLVDGEPATHVSVLDRGLHYGDGVFETISCPGGRPRLLQQHLERLVHGCERLAIPIGDLQTIHDEITRAAAGTTCILKLIVTRGDAVARGYTPTGSERTRRILMRFDWPAERAEWSRDGVVVAIARHRIGENPALAGLKHLNRLEQVLASQEFATHHEAFEGLMADQENRVVEGTRSNLFLVLDGRWLTPALTRCGVRGILREDLLSHFRGRLEEADIPLARLHEAAELFVANSVIGVVPVTRLQLDGNVLERAIGSFTQAAMARFRETLTT